MPTPTQAAPTPEAAPLTDWRIGDAGHTIFGPKREDGPPLILATFKDRKACALAGAAPELAGALRALLEYEGDRVFTGIGLEVDSPPLEAAKQAARAALAKAGL